MIRCIEARNFRCLRSIRQPLGRFHVLVGKNASGKSTFLDVPSFLGQLTMVGVTATVKMRTNNFFDLTWNRKENGFELAIEVTLPRELHMPTEAPSHNTIRHTLGIIQDGVEPLGINREQISLISPDKCGNQTTDRTECDLFGVGSESSAVVFAEWKRTAPGVTVGTIGGEPGTQPEAPSALWGMREQSEYSWLSMLARLESNRRPILVSAFKMLTTQVVVISLESNALRDPSPPAQGTTMQKNGGNFPWAVSRLQEQDHARHEDWIAHMRTVLPDLQGIRVVERPEDRHRYLMVQYAGGVEVPSWMVSDGTLRLLALTHLAYLPPPHPIYLIEEPENSMHPQSIEAVMQSLQSVYEG